VDFPRFFQLGADAKRGIQRRHGALQNEADFFAAKRSNFPFTQSHQVAAVEMDRTLSLCSLQIKQFQDSQRQRALAAATLPDQPKDFLPADVQRKLA